MHIYNMYTFTDDIDVGFNGVDTIFAKTKHALQQGLGGIMIWEVGQDCRLSPVTHGDTTHVRTCPGEEPKKGEEDESSLLVAISKAARAEGRTLMFVHDKSPGVNGKGGVEGVGEQHSEHAEL